MKQDLSNIDTVLLDIEGTICPISFVKETLFPYAIKALPEVLKQKWDDPDFAQYRDAFPEEARTSPEVLEAYVQDLTRRDVKVACLKNLQGYLWKTGYTSGTIKTPLFPDVLPTLRTWRNTNNKTLAIYSSGSIFAQHLLFEHIAHPSPLSTSTSTSTSTATATIDARDLITAWYDTTNAGIKTSPQSYTSIATSIGKDPKRILFFSDVPGEVDAAIEAGMSGVLVEREGNALLSEEVRGWCDVVRELEEVKLM